MNWYVYHTSGGCNYGDHSWGLEEFVTEAEARGWIEENARRLCDGEFFLIHGEIVDSSGRPLNPGNTGVDP